MDMENRSNQKWEGKNTKMERRKNEVVEELVEEVVSVEKMVAVPL